MGNCKDCKHWSVWTKGECDRINQIQRDPSTEFWIDADASDDTGLTAMLMTSPMFGCVQFTQKENNNEN